MSTDWSVPWYWNFTLWCHDRGWSQMPVWILLWPSAIMANALITVWYRVPTPPGKSWILKIKFPGPGKSWKMDLVLESPENFSGRSWEVLEIFARLWRGRQTQWCRCRCCWSLKLLNFFLQSAVYNVNSCDKFFDNLFAISQWQWSTYTLSLIHIWRCRRRG